MEKNIRAFLDIYRNRSSSDLVDLVDYCSFKSAGLSNQFFSMQSIWGTGLLVVASLPPVDLGQFWCHPKPPIWLQRHLPPPPLSSFSPGQFVQRPPIRLSRRRVSQVLVSQLFRAIFYSLCFPDNCQQGCFPLIGSLLRFERQKIYLKIVHCTFRSNIPLNTLTVSDLDWRYRQLFTGWL